MNTLVILARDFLKGEREKFDYGVFNLRLNV